MTVLRGASLIGQGAEILRVYCKDIRGHRRASPLETPERKLARLPNAARRIVGTGADVAPLPADEGRDLAYDVDTARIIVHMV